MLKFQGSPLYKVQQRNGVKMEKYRQLERHSEKEMMTDEVGRLAISTST